MRFTALFLLIFLLCHAVITHAQVVFELNDDRDELLLAINDLYMYEDTGGDMSFNQMRNGSQLFKKHKDFQPVDYNTKSTYWVRLDLHLPKELYRQWLIEFYDQTIDSITVYQPIAHAKFAAQEMGDLLPFNNKYLRHKNFEVPIHFDAGEFQTYYFKIKSHSYADIRLAVRTVPRFVHYSLNEYLLYGLFYGMILIIILYNILIFFAIREIKYLYYTFYIACVGIYAMCVDGIAYQYLWPESPGWNQIAYGVSLFLLIFWSLMFGQRFLNLRFRAPRLYEIIKWTLVIRTILFLYALFVDNSFFDYRNIEVVPLVLIFYSGIYVLLRGYQPARYFVIAYGFLFVGFILKILMHLSVIPFGIWSYYSLHIGFSLEMLFLSFALSDRVRIIKGRRDRALRRIILQHQENSDLKDTVNKELEDRIYHRTLELEKKNLMLEETNQKLYEQTKEINRINSMLDLDNWKLKNNIKEILQDRLLNKNLTFEQFSKVFPDKMNCYHFLERLKWGDDGYHCCKCSNDKYLVGQKKLSRRCSRCGYDESVTSNTVFHGIKFPIQKAFYILYVSNNKNNKYTLDELSELLALRRNTIWNFKKKIIKSFKNHHNKNTAIHIRDLFSSHLN